MSTGKGKRGKQNTKPTLSKTGFSPLTQSLSNTKGTKRFRTARDVTYTSSELKHAARWSRQVIDVVYGNRVGFTHKGFHVGKV